MFVPASSPFKLPYTQSLSRTAKGIALAVFSVVRYIKRPNEGEASNTKVDYNIYILTERVNSATNKIKIFYNYLIEKDNKVVTCNQLITFSVIHNVLAINLN